MVEKQPVVPGAGWSWRRHVSLVAIISRHQHRPMDSPTHRPLGGPTWQILQLRGLWNRGTAPAHADAQPATAVRHCLIDVIGDCGTGSDPVRAAQPGL